ncbi:MAG: preprotein translocase subunit SecA [Rickettsiaceae bacterium]|nr:preprotein translocase subunit SecA [Rickettsiaceae bacterium]
MLRLFRNFFGTANDRIVKKLFTKVSSINRYEPNLASLPDEQLKNKTEEFKNRLSLGATLDEISEEAFAVVREASKRVLGMRHFDVQCVGGLILHQGNITEMRTGEGKTLVATLAAYLNALEGKGVHVVTTNDYLAKRDSEWMGKLYHFLGLSTGCIESNMDDYERKLAYSADITYATNNELGFDYLRDNMKFDLESKVQRGFHYAIIDEVDSILIDEARTPLIISGPADDHSELYIIIDLLVRKLNKEAYELDEKTKTVNLTEIGIEQIEDLLTTAQLINKDSSLYDFENMHLVHYVNQSLKAHHLFSKNVDYLIQNNKLNIIDEFTGRVIDGRRYSDGLHQALEAKEKVPIQQENQTLASITFQNYFRQYKKLSGMTGTAMTEAAELKDIYNLEVIAVPTHHPAKRIDHDDEIYGTKKEKNNAILDLVTQCYTKGQPVLVGTVSVEKSEEISSILKKEKIPHNILNAKNHEKEAHIIAQAGRFNSVTIATNMAGRGTDIKLGGNAEMLFSEVEKTLSPSEKLVKKLEIERQVEHEKQKVIEAGGLYVIASERHESRRIDNQLRGRSGRQGDPGETKFFLSLEDDLMRIFASPTISGLLRSLGLKDGEAIFHPMISRSLEKAQQKVEAHNYDMRKSLLKFDDVMNDQRKVVYEQRDDIISAQDLMPTLLELTYNLLDALIKKYIPQDSFKEEWNLADLIHEISRIFMFKLDPESYLARDLLETDLLEEISSSLEMRIKEKRQNLSENIFDNSIKFIFLSILDNCWKDHLRSLDHLRQGIYLRAYGQKDPLNEYKREAFELFNNMLDNYAEQVVSACFQFQIDTSNANNIEQIAKRKRGVRKTFATRDDPAFEKYNKTGATVDAILSPIKTSVPKEQRKKDDSSTWGKVARNEECPCGSGKKYKHCHGSIK